ncbi:MAG: A24 family peptidase [Actinobacteria bacterium]|nr:A24 family peptidase [Actinomycetota bacterium]
MNTIRLLVCIVLAVPCGAWVSSLAEGFVTERPLFQPSDSPRISGRTLAIGITTMVVFVLLGWRFTDASWAELLAYLAGFAVVLLASVIDLTEYRLPDVVVLPSLAIGVVLIASISIVDNSADRMQYAFFAAILAFGVLLIVHLISPQGMGFGDVKFVALLGLMVGWQAHSFGDAVIIVLWLFLIGFAFGTVGGVALMVLRGRSQAFPFGPFLAIGALVTVLFSRALVG